MKSKFTVKVDWSDLEPQWDFTEMSELALAAAKERVEKQLDKELHATLDYMRDHAHELATNPHDMILNGDPGAWTTGLLPNQVIRLDIPDAFLRHPRALPIELKGIAV
jgi:hypothetical protein